MINDNFQTTGGGLQTFFRAPLKRVEDLTPGLTAVLGVPQDFTAGWRQGSKFGPRAIREASLFMNYALQTSERKTTVDIQAGRAYTLPSEPRIVDLGDVVIYQTDVQRSRRSIAETVKEVVRRRAFPVILGGDHYITFPAFEGFHQALRERGVQRFGYIQFDAHLDLADDHPIFGRHSNSTNARRISELDGVNGGNMVWIGWRGVSRIEQWEFLKKAGSRVFTMADIRRDGIQGVCREAIKIAARDADAVYLSVDIDVVDSVYAPGTGGHTFGGLTPPELFTAMETLREGPIEAVDVTEVSPDLDPAGITAEIASGALSTFLLPRIYEVASLK